MHSQKEHACRIEVRLDTDLSTSLTSFAAWPASTRTYHLTEVLLLVVI
jgi:hypothetical protein